LASAVAGEDSFDATLQHVVDFACSGVTNCSTAGFTVLSQRAPTTAVPRAKVGAIQSRVNAGRCLYAYRRQTFNRVDPGGSPKLSWLGLPGGEQEVPECPGAARRTEGNEDP
jgi:hypothetical protein